MVECSAKSDDLGGVPVELPDFTRGAWKTAKPAKIGEIDLVKMGFGGAADVKADGGQIEV